MPRCPSCSVELATPSRFCPSCGPPFAPASEAATVALPQHPPSSSSRNIDEGRFLAGTLLGSRYRIIGLLGRGGMGEVYRANDLTLGQPVAIKFLPEAVAGNERMLARFHSEVRIARQVSHPNVCRVYDIGEYQGSTYITMEYVDGEDLASLLRRIGRLPADKGIEFARRLCAGLAAAHDKGVLHRDLKPANVMIDGRGQVLITDFGLAGFAGQIEGGEIRNGTPAYMAPEQLAGKEVSVRSDIYALGLIFYEMFTGKGAFEDPIRRITPTSVSTLVKDIDPAVERVILRCLEEDPRARPHSALAVAAALPGGDPLAAALAAGETPSPEMVAAAGETEGLRVRTAVMCLAVILAGLPVAVWLEGKLNIFQQMPFEKSPEVLAQKAREDIQTLGYTGRPADSAFGFGVDSDYGRYANEQQKPADVRAQLAKGQPPFIAFWYRQSPRYLTPVDPNGQVDPGDPPREVSGMVGVWLDSQGRLLRFAAVPPQVDDTAAHPSAASPDPAALFSAAGLDLARFTATVPKWTPLAVCDARAAWTGSWPDAPTLPLRVEAAWWRAKPVDFRLIGPWTVPERMQESSQLSGQKAVGWIIISLIAALFAVALLLAWRNYRMGRGDRRGAVRIFAFLLCCNLLSWLFTAKHVPGLNEFFLLTWAIGSALFWAACYGVLYLALEPYVRRRWPQSLISWSRLLAGGIRDSTVGGQTIFSIAIGIVITIVAALRFLHVQQYQALPQIVFGLGGITDARHLTGSFIASAASALQLLLVFFLFFLLRVLCRRQWLAFAVWLLLGCALVALSSPRPLVEVPYALVGLAVIPLMLIRMGLLPVVVSFYVENLLIAFAVTTDFSAWYATPTYVVLAVILFLTAFSFHTARAGRPLFKENFLE